MKLEFDEASAEEAQTHLTLELKKKIMGENMAKFYDINPTNFLRETLKESSTIAAE